MKNSKYSACVLTLIALAFAPIARAHGGSAETVVVVEPGRPVVERSAGPSVFVSGYRGLLSGAFVGASTAYLLTRHDGFAGDDFRSLGFGAGIGAVSGAGVGVAVGLLALANDGSRADVVLRDTLYGTTFGGLTGAIAGSLFVIKSGDPENILFGGAIGVVAGASIGLTVGLLDGLGGFGRRETCGRGQCSARSAPRYAPALAAASDARGSLVLTPAFAGRF